MERTIKKISQFYYLIYTVTILTTVVGYFLIMNSDSHINSLSPLGITLKSIVIIYMLISIPLSIGGFYYMINKWKTIENLTLKLKEYQKGSIMRLLLIGIGLIGSIIVFFVLRTDVSLIYCAAIAAIALLFCRPSEAKITTELNLDETEE
jgi:hypothetical protein